jgi:protein phosphatase PTC7
LDTCVSAGIADGVGGWSEIGVNPSLFSWGLMEHAEAQCKASCAVQEAGKILTNAYEALVASKTVDAGSSTAVVVTLDRTKGLLHTANLGGIILFIFLFTLKPSCL